METNIHLSFDDQETGACNVRDMVATLIKNEFRMQMRAVLETQLKDMVIGEIGRLKLNNLDQSGPLEGVLKGHIETIVTKIVKSHVPVAVHEELRRKFT